MRYKYHVVVIVTFLLVSLSLIISIVNYGVSLKSTQAQLKGRSLPLTVDNIYTEIQKQIIEPNLVASMMAHDTFLKDWLMHQEHDAEKISVYLETIKNKYKMFTTFLVSEKTRNYYTQKGLLEQVVEGNQNNAWYFNFKEKPKDHEINLDFNDYIDDAMIMFINHKIFDEQYHMIGATGVGLKISYVNDMLKYFRQKYHFSVYFLNKKCDVVLYERGVNSLRNLEDISELRFLRDSIISKESRVVEYTKEDEEYLLNTKYIPELDLYLVVEAKLSEFINEVKKTFYFNMISSLLVSLLVTVLILKTVKNHHEKLRYLANYDDLTNLKNRRALDEELKQCFLLSQRRDSSLVLMFFDLDDFKMINDTRGHQIGDKVLKRVADILKDNLRRTDIVGRWGGEEFVASMIDTELESALSITEKIRLNIEKDALLFQLANGRVTASFGLTKLKQQDTIDSFINRADEGLYKAKENGKNRVVCIE